MATRPDGTPAAPWFAAPPHAFTARVEHGRSILHFDLGPDGKAFLLHGTGRFSAPPKHGGIPIEGGRFTMFSVDARVLAGSPRVSLWALEYDDESQTGDARTPIRPGMNTLRFLASGRSLVVRPVIRVAGSGTIALGPIRLSFLAPGSASEPAPVLARSTAPTPRGSEGEDLVFIMGPPRSGTTWLLRLFQEHPACTIADLDNLDARVNEVVSMETMIFHDQRPFTDDEIKERFHRLSRAHPGTVVVEKTPAHVLFADRIRSVFPKAALVVAQRDGRDVVASMLEIARDDAAWWKNAPGSLERAARLWRQHAEAGLYCAVHFGAITVRYEQLLASPVEVASELFERLGLETGSVEDQVRATAGGRGIPIDGVYRGGDVGKWRRVLSAEEVEAFRRITGDALVRLGYENDHP